MSRRPVSRIAPDGEVAQGCHHAGSGSRADGEAKYIGRFAEFFASHDPDVADHANKAELMSEFQTIKGVGPYTAAIIAGHAVRDPSALGLDVWNRKLLATRFLGVDDAEAAVVMAEMTRLFPGYEGLAGLYVIEDAYRDQAVVELVE